ncbi:TPA: hypothetical protein DEG75_02120 [Candidatus Dependentiae bacterium]|nr:hypothetical protein [Candidatus Dependentiae bacterium]
MEKNLSVKTSQSIDLEDKYVRSAHPECLMLCTAKKFTMSRVEFTPTAHPDGSLRYALLLWVNYLFEIHFFFEKTLTMSGCIEGARW